MINCMKYHDLRDFLALLEKQGELKRITLPVDPYLEMTEIADRTLRAGGPALLRYACTVQPVWHTSPRGDGHGAGRCHGAA